MKRLTLVCIVLLVSVSLANVGTVGACSGSELPYGPFGMMLQPDNEALIVAGRIDTLSDSGLNAVLQIDQVIRGELTAEFIMFYQERPEIILEGRGLMACHYHFNPRLPPGRRFIGNPYPGQLFIADEDGLFRVDNPDDKIETLTLTYAEIVDLTAQRLKTTPYAPQNRIKPRPVAVELTTETGDTYLLPADQITVTKQPPPYEYDCRAYNNSRCIISPAGVDRVWLEPIGSNPQKMVQPVNYEARVEGTAGVFAPASDLLTVWAGQKLSVYITAEQRGIAENNYGLADLRTLDFDSNDPLIPGAGAWSPNGRTFAFTSASGVWLWDALAPESQPVLFIPSTDTPILVHQFSPVGNYLALSEQEHLYYLDIATQKEYPYGVFSPDDRLLATFDPSGDAPLDIYRVLPKMEPLWGSSFPNATWTQFEWIDRNTYLYAACGEAMPQDRDFLPPAFMEPWCQVKKGYLNAYQEGEWIEGVLFDYDPITSSLATLIDGDTITVNGEIIELEGQVDSPIVAIELIPLIDLDYRNF